MSLTFILIHNVPDKISLYTSTSMDVIHQTGRGRNQGNKQSQYVPFFHLSRKPIKQDQ